MAEYDNTNKGIISKNADKKADTHADIKGHINIEGVEYWLDGYLKKRNSDGGSFYSLTAKPKQPKPEPMPQGGFSAALDDDIPFAPEFR
jgi:hypothetical protein